MKCLLKIKCGREGSSLANGLRQLHRCGKSFCCLDGLLCAHRDAAEGGARRS